LHTVIPKDAPTIARLRSGRRINWHSIPDQGKRYFSLLRKFDITFKAHPTSYPMGMGGYFPGVKRLRPEANYSLPTTAEVKSVWSYASIPYTSSWLHA
jgi:hypothetical protein